MFINASKNVQRLIKPFIQKKMMTMNTRHEAKI